MRIVHYLGHYPRPAGTTKAVGGLARKQARAGHEVTVLTHEAGRVPEDEAAGLRVVTVARGRLGGWLPSRELREFLRGNRGALDLVVLHGMFNPALAAVGSLLLRIGLPYVVATHCGYHPAMMRRRAWRKRLYLPIERRLLNGSIGVQVLADSQHESVRRIGVTAPVFTACNGFSPYEARPLPPEVVPGVAGRLLFLGRLDAYAKGLDVLCEALAIGPSEWSLTVIGPDWGDNQSLHALVSRHGIAQRVTFAGPDYSRPPVEIVSDYDVVVVPSRYEGFGFTALEAMLARRPVIVSSEAGIASHVKIAGCGWIAVPEPAALADALRRAWGERAQWPKLGEFGRTYALEHLDWERIARESVEQYARLLQLSDKRRTPC